MSKLTKIALIVWFFSFAFYCLGVHVGKHTERQSSRGYMISMQSYYDGVADGQKGIENN